MVTCKVRFVKNKLISVAHAVQVDCTIISWSWCVGSNVWIRASPQWQVLCCVPGALVSTRRKEEVVKRQQGRENPSATGACGEHCVAHLIWSHWVRKFVKLMPCGGTCGLWTQALQHIVYGSQCQYCFCCVANWCISTLKQKFLKNVVRYNYLKILKTVLVMGNMLTSVLFDRSDH